MLPEDRYRHDPLFRILVDALEQQLHTARFTPLELREAAVLAAIRYETRRPPAPVRVRVRGRVPEGVAQVLRETAQGDRGGIEVVPPEIPVESASDRRAREHRERVDPDARIPRRPSDYLAALQARDLANWGAQVNGVWPPTEDQEAGAPAYQERPTGYQRAAAAADVPVDPPLPGPAL